MIRDFRDRVAVVTGGGSGIGEAIARALVERGAHVALLDVREETDAVARALGTSGRRVSSHHLDVAARDAWGPALDAVVATHGGIDLLVNSAGVSVAGRFEDVSAADFDWLLAINFGGVVNGCRAALPHLRRSDSAHIVNVCSSFAWLGFPGKSAYASSKAAVRAFSESLRAELAATSVGVSLLFPGPVDTRLVREGRAVDPAQLSAEAEFLARRAIDPRVVADRCLEGVRRDRARIVVGFDYRVFDLGVRLAPSLALHAVTKLAGKGPI